MWMGSNSDFPSQTPQVRPNSTIYTLKQDDEHPRLFYVSHPRSSPSVDFSCNFFLDVTLGFILCISHRSPSYFSLTLSNFSTYLLNSKNRICLLSKTARKPKKHSRNCGRQLSKRKIECKNSVTVNLVFIVFLDPVHTNAFSKCFHRKRIDRFVSNQTNVLMRFRMSTLKRLKTIEFHIVT